MKSRTPLILFALLGLGASLTSTYVHYNLLVDRSFSSFCDVNATVSCTQAYLSPYGTFMGVPVALAGVFFFAVVLALAALSGRKTPRRARAPPPTSSRCPPSAWPSRSILVTRRSSSSTRSASCA